MAYKKGHPIRITLSRNDCNLLTGALKSNEDNFNGFIFDGATALREKIEKYGVPETDEEGKEFIRLGFYEKEAERLIWQFVAFASTTSDMLDTEIENPL